MNDHPIKVLLVDDNPLDAHLAQRLLQKLQADLPTVIKWVESAEAAIAEAQHTAYDVCLLDYQLPHGTGLEVLAAFREMPLNYQPAVIMLTASGNEKVAVEAMKRGARDYLRKEDLEVTPLMRAIMSALSQKRLQDQVSRYMAQTQAELKMARQFQHALLSERFPVFPRGVEAAQSLLKFHARYLSTTELGGDFYDVFPISNTTAGILMCDVMGHGVRAALVTAVIRGLAEELITVAHDPSLFLAGMNHGLGTILQDVEDPLFACAFYMVADTGTGLVQYANSGLPWPLYLDRMSGRIESMEGKTGESGPPLGMSEESTYPAAACQFAGGAAMLLYTDGIYEVTCKSGEEYGLERLRAAVRGNLDRPMAELLDRVISDARGFSEEGEFADDVCLLAVEAGAQGGVALKPS